MTWEDVLKRDDIVGGDIETHEDGDIFRGPIESIALRDGVVLIRSPWIATTPELGNPNCGQWKKHSGASFCYVNVEIPPEDIGQDRLQFNMPLLGIGIIFPKGGSKLDPAKVEGLIVA